MDRFHGDEPYRRLGRKSGEEWSSFTAPPVDARPTRPGSRTSEFALLGALAAFLLATFAPWQRLCMNLSTPILHFNGCVSANAWSGDGSGFGVAAGVATILACMALVLHLAGALEGESADWLERVLVYSAVGLGAAKWLNVITRAAAVGAWLGVLLLFAVAAIETVRTQNGR
jgi:hypothetical protein